MSASLPFHVGRTTHPCSKCKTDTPHDLSEEVGHVPGNALIKTCTKCRHKHVRDDLEE